MGLLKCSFKSATISKFTSKIIQKNLNVSTYTRIFSTII
jgi:hypothetical protein